MVLIVKHGIMIAVQHRCEIAACRWLRERVREREGLASGGGGIAIEHNEVGIVEHGRALRVGAPQQRIERHAVDYER